MLANGGIFTESDGSPLRLLREENIVAWQWQPGLRLHLKRLLMVDMTPPLPEGQKASHRLLMLKLRNTRQKWRIYDTPLYNLHFPRRPMPVRTPAGRCGGTLTSCPQ